MRIIDILKSAECSNIFLEVNEFVHDHLFEYNNAIERDGFSFQDKDVFDLVWGTVGMSAAEVCVIDSPLLQRLRRIRQLGMASTVYCNADHSRFSHTIGVLEVAGRMASVITKKLNKDYSANFSFTEIVRLAAVFHDVGHMFFSHVSESYFTYNSSFVRHKEVTKAKSFFCEKTSSTTSFHELLSVMIVNSHETIRLIKIISQYSLQSKFSEDEFCEQFIEYISCLIIGVPVDKLILPYSMIINSAIDADKLDYLSRDSACTKVPIAVDIARIIQKLDVVYTEQLPNTQIWNDYTGDSTPLSIMVIKDSAKKVFWQLSAARSSMFESVYYHHKVLTTEAMFRMALSKIFEDYHIDRFNFSNMLKITDGYFGEYFASILVDEPNRLGNNCEIATQILTKVRDRSLYKRVASFSRNSIIAPVEVSREFIGKVIKNPISHEYNKFHAEMVKEYIEIRKILCKPCITDSPVFMFIELKYQEMDSMPIESGNGYFVWSSAMKQETIEAGRKAKQEQYYLITDRSDRDIVYLALEKVVSSFGITNLSRESSICAKYKVEQMNRTRNRLLEANYYYNHLYLIPDDLFKQLFDINIFKAVVKKYQSFNGVNNCKVTPKSLHIFLRQFLRTPCNKEEMKSILDGVLRILNSALFIEREYFAKSVSVLLKSVTEKKHLKNYITKLGGQFDSATHLSYYFNDIKEKKDFIFSEQAEAHLDVLNSDDSLTFFDDGAYSGKQVVSIFQEYMGVPVDERSTNEHHVNELSEGHKKVLKKANITLVYLCFNTQSLSYIQGEMNKLGIENVDIIYTNDLSTKIFENKGNNFRDDDQRELLRKCFYDIGKNILISRNQLEDGRYKDRWSLERIEDCALGYNDAQQMIVFESNIPTYSTCAFWTTEKDDETVWKGLFQRTLKD